MDKRFFKILILGASLLGTAATPVFSQGLAGPYLAANRAFEHGSFDAAARYFVRAMAADPANVRLKQSAMVSFVAAGDFEPAARIASVMRANDQADVFVDLVALTDLADKGDYESAKLAIAPNRDFLSPLLWGLLDAWIKIGAGEIEAGFKAFDRLSEDDTLEMYGKYNKALAQAYLGDFEAAAEILGGNGDGPLHLNRDSIVIHVEVLSELGRKDEALQVLDEAIVRGFQDEQILSLRDEVALGNLPKFSHVNAPTYGMSEAFVTLADLLSRGEPDRTALFYARLAQHLQPDLVDASLLVAELLELEDQFNLAEQAYGLIPEGSPSYKAAEIGRAEALRAAGDTDGATEILVELADSFPDDVLVLNALGDIYRGVEKFAESVDAYTKAIANVTEFGSQHWVLFYTRGIGYEQLDDWPAAEKDLRRALELSPDQPFVLNYIAYSYIEMGINFEEAQMMIETAVAGMPSNGYITDSLGWVLYRVGKFEEAVGPMERAVELLPVDPIVNDHLGDVLWMVGRKLEAEFQWRRAMSFDPSADDLERIKRKLEVGLDVVLEEESAN
ncbi:MAG: tetratricopeptide repeat protein [Rhodobacteraceae bacterium]|nr:tetratricopeptide repeat protein [Paracoccaceae bacterium]